MGSSPHRSGGGGGAGIKGLLQTSTFYKHQAETD